MTEYAITMADIKLTAAGSACEMLERGHIVAFVKVNGDSFGHISHWAGEPRWNALWFDWQADGSAKAITDWDLGSARVALAHLLDQSGYDLEDLADLARAHFDRLGGPLD